MRVVTVQASISYLLLPTTTGLVSVCPPVLTHITCHARVIGKAGACGTLISCDAEVYQPLLMVAFNPDSCKLVFFFFFLLCTSLVSDGSPDSASYSGSCY